MKKKDRGATHRNEYFFRFWDWSRIQTLYSFEVFFVLTNNEY